MRVKGREKKTEKERIERKEERGGVRVSVHQQKS